MLKASSLQGETPVLVFADGTAISEAPAICRYFENAEPGRKILGITPLEQALDDQWTQRIWVHLIYRLTVAFHVLLNGLGVLELTTNHAWGEHCRKEALATAAILDKHLSDGRQWMIGGAEPTYSDINLCTAISLSKAKSISLDLTHRFEFLDKFWKRWQERESFKMAYADGAGLTELDYLTEASRASKM
ncbi:MAG: hypothetical protein CYPHOPRED_001330 [Cyphobasidiales sp. Tagirdzhanova-0007]|nr:MAG: hypothetical protein CYPHOPRED_001330 [Cyphobasidiales sp. Tagirdzhanova-0007]